MPFSEQQQLRLVPQKSMCSSEYAAVNMAAVKLMPQVWHQQSMAWHDMT
jgi:hypothetical protein